MTHNEALSNEQSAALLPPGLVQKWAEQEKFAQVSALFAVHHAIASRKMFVKLFLWALGLVAVCVITLTCTHGIISDWIEYVSGILCVVLFSMIMIVATILAYSLSLKKMSYAVKARSIILDDLALLNKELRHNQDSDYVRYLLDRQSKGEDVTTEISYLDIPWIMVEELTTITARAEELITSRAYQIYLAEIRKQPFVVKDHEIRLGKMQLIFASFGLLKPLHIYRARAFARLTYEQQQSYQPPVPMKV